jgi:ABC-type multidrug transport system ATPase subunit
MAAVMGNSVTTAELCKSFGPVAAIDKVSFSAPEAELFGLIGADGAGKSTLLRILATLLRPDSGSAQVLGFDTVADFSSIRKRIGFMPQKFSLYGDLSVRENLRFFADVFGISGADARRRMAQLLDFSRLADFQNRRAAQLSGGMKQKLALSCCLIHEPELLILDEPTTGVDPVSRREFWRILSDLKQQGMTIIVSTPYMDEAALCDRLIILHRGAVMQQGSPAALLAAYPLGLYKITSSRGALGVPPAGTPLPPGVSLMYPAAGDLHLAGKDLYDADNTLERVRAVLPNADAIGRIAPSIEDLLFQILSEQEAA